MTPAEMITVDRKSGGHVNRWIGPALDDAIRKRHAVAIRWSDGTLLIQIKGEDGDDDVYGGRRAHMILSREEMIALGVALIQTAMENQNGQG